MVVVIVWGQWHVYHSAHVEVGEQLGVGSYLHPPWSSSRLVSEPCYSHAVAQAGLNLSLSLQVLR